MYDIHFFRYVRKEMTTEKNGRIVGWIKIQKSLKKSTPDQTPASHRLSIPTAKNTGVNILGHKKAKWKMAFTTLAGVQGETIKKQ